MAGTAGEPAGVVSGVGGSGQASPRHVAREVDAG